MSPSTTKPSEDVQNRPQQAPLPPTRPEARPPAPLSRLFPLGYKEGFSQWVRMPTDALHAFFVLDSLQLLQS